MPTFLSDVEVIYKTGKGRLPDVLTPAVLCLELGWTVAELRAAPAWLVNDIVLLIDARNSDSGK